MSVNLEDVCEEVHVCTSGGGHDGHSEGGVDVLEVVPYWCLTKTTIISCEIFISQCQGQDS